MANVKKNAKREAYAKKQETSGVKIIAGIIGALIVAAIIYVGWVCYMMS